jgi:hypothetical protein
MFDVVIIRRRFVKVFDIITGVTYIGYIIIGQETICCIVIFHQIPNIRLRIKKSVRRGWSREYQQLFDIHQNYLDDPAKRNTYHIVRIDS